jgi:hypothetical protein
MALSAEAEQYVADYVDAADGLIRSGIEAAVAPTLGAAGMSSQATADAVNDAFARRWPDGLTLSDRVWRWQEQTRRGVSDALADGLRLQRSAGSIVMDMQRAIEAAAGDRFAIVTQPRMDWAERLADAGRRTARDPRMLRDWLDAVKEAEAHVQTLRDGGTRRQARVAMQGIKDAVEAGRQDLVDKRLRWWVYDRQLYSLRRVVRTEMATAQHRAVIQAGGAEDGIIGYHWRLSASHPEPDICDYYAGVDFGLGKGVWPASNVPQSKAHPHCMCALVPRVTPVKERGAVDLEQFLDTVPASTRREMVPKWAEELRRQGVPWSRMTRADGRWLMSREEALAAGVLDEEGRPVAAVV